MQKTPENRCLVSLAKLIFGWYLLYMTWFRRRIISGELKLFNIRMGKLLACLHLYFTHGQGQAVAILFLKYDSLLLPLHSSYSMKGLQVKRKQKTSWKSELLLTENAHVLYVAGSHLSQILLVGCCEHLTSVLCLWFNDLHAISCEQKSPMS